jgi:ethanolamine utilization cobalamin adenosyltransferase
MHGGIIMINRVCSYCGSNTGYDNNKESNGYWYSLVTRDNKTCLYFLCSNCYAKQTDKNPEWNQIINTKSQNRKELEHKTKNFCHNPILIENMFHTKDIKAAIKLDRTRTRINKIR